MTNFKDLPQKQQVIDLSVDKQNLIEKRTFQEVLKTFKPEKLNIPKGDSKPK